MAFMTAMLVVPLLIMCLPDAALVKSLVTCQPSKPPPELGRHAISRSDTFKDKTKK